MKHAFFFKDNNSGFFSLPQVWQNWKQGFTFGAHRYTPKTWNSSRSNDRNNFARLRWDHGQFLLRGDPNLETQNCKKKLFLETFFFIYNSQTTCTVSATLRKCTLYSYIGSKFHIQAIWKHVLKSFSIFIRICFFVTTQSFAIMKGWDKPLSEPIFPLKKGGAQSSSGVSAVTMGTRRPILRLADMLGEAARDWPMSAHCHHADIAAGFRKWSVLTFHHVFNKEIGLARL